jgi:hypothetical protein
MTNFQKKINGLMEECERWVNNKKQVLVVTTTRKEADILAQ